MTPSRSEFFEWLDNRQSTSGYRAIATIDRTPGANDHFETEWIRPGADLGTQKKHHDWYFTPLMFTNPQRMNQFATGRTLLFADLDAAPLPLEVKPTALWETSPGSTQAIWALSGCPDYDTWADINRRMTYFVGADRGGWPGSKLLRMPGSINWKRGGVRGQWLEFTPWLEYHTPSLDSLLTRLEPEVFDGGRDCPPIPKPADVPVSKVPLSVAAMLSKQKVGDRSLTIWKAAGMLARSGVSSEDAFAIIWYAPWNKWQHKPGRLWKDITRAYASHSA